MTKDVEGYVEFEYSDNEIVNIYNQEFSYQTISSNSYIELDNGIKINLGTKIVSQNEDNKMSLEDMVINLDTHEIFIGDKEIKLTPTEFDILVLLSKNKGKVFSIANIYESVWNQEFLESDNTVMVHIRKIREKTEENPRKPKFIKTVWGVGYKIEK